MAERMVLDPMPAAVDLRGQVRMGGDLAPEAEERGAGAAAVEPVEHGRRHLGMRPVVEGERDLVRRPAEARQVRSQQPAARATFPPRR